MVLKNNAGLAWYDRVALIAEYLVLFTEPHSFFWDSECHRPDSFDQKEGKGKGIGLFLNLWFRGKKEQNRFLLPESL